MNTPPSQHFELIEQGTQRLITRAAASRFLNASALTTRISVALHKYLLRDRPNATPQEINEFIDALHADDLCLIVACEGGDEAAWRELIEKYQGTTRVAARAICASEDRAEDLVQSIWAELHGLRLREDGKTSGKIAYYSGRGSLGGWLQAIVRQLAVDAHRKESKLVQAETDADFDNLARGENDNGQLPEQKISRSLANPEQAFAERELAQIVEKALERAIGELNAEDRLLLKLYYFDDLSLREAGAILGVHEATASRRLTRAHKELRARIETILVNNYGLTREDATHSISEAAAHLETNLERLLTNEKAHIER